MNLDFLAPTWNTFVFNPMVNLLLFIYTAIRAFEIVNIIGSFGIAIILFTLLIRLITLPFYSQQQKAMKKQQRLMAGDEWKALQKKYAKDRERLSQEQMRLYREGGVNPLGGCLPALIPWPIMLGLYQSITMVMGTQPEQLMELSRHLYNFPQLFAAVPVQNDFLGLNLAAHPDFAAPLTLVIPALVLASTWIQQKMMAVPSTDSNQAQMNQSMQLMMPIMIGWFSLSFPIGLSLYWIVFNVVGIVQQYLNSGWGNLFGNSALAQAPAVTKVTSVTSKGKKNGRK